ncbi:fatty acid alpha-hydroxylase [Apophysomyces ossiformis]|uniref:Ceramide very long chain fatty acid hydroxylase n=1 Tax=Apophysomyces ossiformis TaxID=679940 RepID=A0A8H7BNL0_9FUNG|nr:fatty acid alpha-hydroxylase [Apophysomyces ossiformis]
MTVTYTYAEVAKHCTAKSCWVICNDKVYDVSEFIVDHPGGDDLILDYAGKDVTAVMQDVIEHAHSDAAYEILEEYCIGTVDHSTGVSSAVKLTERERLHRQRMQLLDEEEESKTYTKEDFKPKETDLNMDVKKNQFLDPRKALIPQMYRARFTKEFYLEQVHKPRYLPHPAIFFGHWLLEPLTKTAWYMVPILWLPYVGYQLMHSLSFGMPIVTLLTFALGILIWTLLEYGLHRFLFHFDDYMPEHHLAFLIHFTLHGFHHYLPMDRLRLVMPPALGVVIAYPLVKLGYSLFPPFVAHGVIAGGVFGYVLYDCTHYYLHHAKVFKFHFREMKKYHMAHHYKNFEAAYGITSKIWDYVFGTGFAYESTL